MNEFLKTRHKTSYVFINNQIVGSKSVEFNNHDFYSCSWSDNQESTAVVGPGFKKHDKISPSSQTNSLGVGLR